MNEETIKTIEERKFDDKWIPIIRKLRKKDEKSLSPSMGECLLIIKKELI